jgi:class 3 adenylate cyclase/tetratricopeptide (TPR) repeat protein
MSTESRNQEFSIEENDNHIQSKVIDEQSWSAILPYLPGVLVESICHNPERHPPWIDPIVGSLLLADISGFTRMSEQLATVGKEGAEWLTDIINDYFHSMLDIATKNGGTNLKFGGDALLILFQGDNHAYRAVTAAIEMQRTTRKFAAYHAGQYRFHLNMTIGVHSGTFWSAVAGLPGQRMQHFILGEVTSQLCEIESATSAGRLCISDTTLGMLGELCITEPHGNIHRVLRLKRLHLTPSTNEYRLPPVLRTSELFAYLPPTVIESLNSGINLQGTIGEHRKVTIAFINLLEINEVLDEQGPEVLLAEIQQYLSLIVRLTEQYGGFIASNDVYNVGLKLIVVFGAPVAHEHDSANTLRFSLELNHEIARLNTRIRHRIGINSGFVFAGDVGPSYSRQYTVMGDAVNLAARLMSAASPNQTLLSGWVSSEAGLGFLTQQLPPIRVKGKVEPVPICLLQGEQTIEYYEVAKDVGTLFGREDEVESFKQVCHQVENGKVRTIVISGEAGIGKSRLLQEFIKHMLTLGWTIYHGACYSHTSYKPFAPWIFVLNSFFNISPEDDGQARTEKVSSSIKQRLPAFIETSSLLNPLLGLSIPPSPVTQSLNDDTRRRRLFELITELLETTSDFPTSVILEDLHWADPSSIQLASHISRTLHSSHLMLCLTHRPKEELQMELEPSTTITFALSELPQNAALELIKTALEGCELPEQLAEIILSKARGNPLFLEEIVQSIRYSGALDQLLSVPSFRLAQEMESLDVPDRIQALIMSRIDTLNISTKELLRVASVIGNSFDVPTLRSIIDVKPGESSLEARLQELVQLDMAVREQAQEFAYRFKHALIQEVAYNSLLFARRRKLHHQVASYLEESHMEKLESFYEVLLYHYGRSSDSLKTRLYSIKAAEKARQVFAHEEAIELYRQGLNLLYGKDVSLACERSYFLERIGDCYEASGHHIEAARTLTQALRQWMSALRHSPASITTPLNFNDEQPIKVRKSALRQKIAAAYERNSDYDSALKYLATALNELPPRQPQQAAKIAITWCLALFRKGQYEDAIRWGRRGLILSRRTDDLHTLAYAYNILATSYLDTGRISRAIRYRLSALELYEELGNISGQAEANNNLGACYQSLGNQEKALHHYGIALALSERIGNLANVAIAHNNVGEVLFTMGNMDEAISHLQKVVETYETKGESLVSCGLALVNLSRVYQQKNDYTNAFDCLEQGTSLLHKAGARGILVEALLQQAELQLATTQIEPAMLTCQSALREARKLGLKLLEARGLRILGRIDSFRGIYERAEANIQQSVTIAKQINADYERGLALLYLAELYVKSMKTRDYQYKGKSTLKQAITIFQRIGAERELAYANTIRTALQS